MPFACLAQTPSVYFLQRFLHVPWREVMCNIASKKRSSRSDWEGHKGMVDGCNSGIHSGVMEGCILLGALVNSLGSKRGQ